MVGILIVDDNVRLRAAVRAELEAHEHVCIVGEAGDGVAAVQLAHSLRPEVVLMDVNMARLDGVAATRSIRTLLPRTVVVGMSCHSPHMVEQAMLSAGADVFLPKDTLGHQLLPAVAQVLTRRTPSAHEAIPESDPSRF
jgi:DNA-binding NarL/FixJ family response regulator